MIRLTLFALLTAVFVHDHSAPELDTWYKSLKSLAGNYCCDGSDAFSVLDPDWDTTTDLEWPYKVQLKGTWVSVHRLAVVKDKNRAGIAKVWPTEHLEIRCFLPGSLT